MKIFTKIKGFTLIELLIVIAIIGILVSIVIIAVNPVRLIGEARDSKKRQELQQLKNSLQLYYNDYHTYPLASSLSTDLVPTYTRSLPTSYMYLGPGESGVPAVEYRAGVILDYPNPNVTPGNDGSTRTNCTSIPSAVISGNDWSAADYFICPD